MFETLRANYARIILLASETTTERTIAELRALGARIKRETQAATIETLGSVRRGALRLGLDVGAEHLHLCDWDRALHWAEQFPNELSATVEAIPSYDCLILGRTSRAFDSHPQVQRDTERIINHCFGLVWGQPLDVTAGSRGLSRRAAERLIAKCDEPTSGNDCVWPLFLAQDPELRIGYVQTEGLEWETPDRFTAEIEAMGGLDAWLIQHDADVGRWSDRLHLADVEVDAVRRWSSLRR